MRRAPIVTRHWLHRALQSGTIIIIVNTACFCATPTQSNYSEVSSINRPINQSTQLADIYKKKQASRTHKNIHSTNQIKKDSQLKMIWQRDQQMDLSEQKQKSTGQRKEGRRQ